MLGSCLLYVDDEVRFEPDHVGNESSWFIVILDSKFGYSRKNGRLGIQYICLFEVRNKTGTANCTEAEFEGALNIWDLLRQQST